VHCHLVTNFLGLPSRPIVLAISGRPGDGKSAQLVAALNRENVRFNRIHAADLESGLAGEPGKYVARMYLETSRAIGRGEPWALVLDDIDTTLGEWEQNTGTVNHQQVLAELMHLADSPTDESRGFLRRVPFFATGNRLGVLYSPLRRYRRLRHFPWEPTPSEIGEVVSTIFHGYAESPAAEALVQAFPRRELAFYAEVKHLCIERRVSGQLPPGSVELRRVVAEARSWRARLQLTSFSAAELLEAAARLSTATADGLRDTVDPPEYSGEAIDIRDQRDRRSGLPGQTSNRRSDG